MAEGACNHFFGGPAMKDHWSRVKWNLKNILDFKSTNPHSKQEERKAYQDLLPSLVNIPTGYAKLCPTKSGRATFILGTCFLVSLVVNIGLVAVILL